MNELAILSTVLALLAFGCIEIEEDGSGVRQQLIALDSPLWTSPWTYEYDAASGVLIVDDGVSTLIIDDAELLAMVPDEQRESELWRRACRMGCIAAASISCGLVRATCTAGTVTTAGGAAVPCVYAVIGACTLTAVAGDWCVEMCGPPEGED